MRRYYQTFEVSGRFRFPLDMLRYDGCFPASEEESRKLADALSPAPKPWRIRLGRYVECRGDMPTIARWKSFLADILLVTISIRRLP